MSGPVFVDTNVIVYAYDTAYPAKQKIAADLLNKLWRGQAGRTSIQVLNELYVTLTRKLARPLRSEEAWDVVHALMVWDPQPIDRSVLLEARQIEQRYRLGWWDSLIISAAQAQGCRMIATEDLQHGMIIDQVLISNPFRAGAQEPTPRYDVVPERTSRHRARGRPRKTA